MKIHPLSILALAFGLSLVASGFATAQEMPPFEAWLMPEDDEVALAISAGPPDVGEHATIKVLRLDGFETVREGTNGFVCYVNRSITSPPPDSPPSILYDTSIRAPICHNAEAARTVGKVQQRRAELFAAGRSPAEVTQAMEEGFRSGAFEIPGRNAMAYMLSSGMALGEFGTPPAHVMVYMPYGTTDEIGKNRFLGPFPFFLGEGGGPLTAVIVPVPEYVDPKPVGDPR